MAKIGIIFEGKVVNYGIYPKGNAEVQFSVTRNITSLNEKYLNSFTEVNDVSPKLLILKGIASSNDDQNYSDFIEKLSKS